MTDTPHTEGPTSRFPSPVRDVGSSERPARRTGAGHELPTRPPLASANRAPVLIKATPPFSIRMAQLLWILSFAVGAFTAVYSFVVRKDLLPLIADVAEGVTAGRSDETYDAAADIVFWVVFATIVGLLLVQVTLLVSFMNRRPQIRWWQLLTLGVQGLLVLLSPEWVALGSQGAVLQPLLAAQAALVLSALLFSILPQGIAWTARRFDLRDGPQRADSTGR